MKVTFKNMFAGYTGNADGMIFYWDPRLQRVLARRTPKIRITQQHIDFGSIAKNLMAIRPSEGFKNDLRTYAERTYNVPEFGGVRPIWNNLWFKLMHALKRANPELDLMSISRAYIELHDLPCRSVKRAVEAGLLPEVRGYSELTREL